MTTKAWLTVFLILLSLAACSQNKNISPAQTTLSTPRPSATNFPSPTPGISPAAQTYLDEVFDIVETQALNKDKVNWDALKEIVAADEQDAETPADTYDSVRRILIWLNDGHSTFLTAEEAEKFNNLDTSDIENPSPQSWLSEEGYAYLYIPEFASGDMKANNMYANQLQQRVKELDASAPCAWVIDLRENGGGNLFAMIAGLSGLIPDGEVAGMQFVTGEIKTSTLAKGQFIDDGEVLVTVEKPLVSLQKPEQVIAILIGPGTISAGEMLALTFKGLQNVTYFGHTTLGLTTGNSLITLSDGSIILLTSARFVDPTGQVYGGSFEPDIPLDGIYKYPKTIPPIVLDWLKNQEVCQE